MSVIVSMSALTEIKKKLKYLDSAFLSNYEQVSKGIEVGKLLIHTKSILPSGSWTAFAKKNFKTKKAPYSVYMRLAREKVHPSYWKLGIDKIIHSFGEKIILLEPCPFLLFKLETGKDSLTTEDLKIVNNKENKEETKMTILNEQEQWCPHCNKITNHRILPFNLADAHFKSQNDMEDRRFSDFLNGGIVRFFIRRYFCNSCNKPWIANEYDTRTMTLIADKINTIEKQLAEEKKSGKTNASLSLREDNTRLRNQVYELESRSKIKTDPVLVSSLEIEYKKKISGLEDELNKYQSIADLINQKANEISAGKIKDLEEELEKSRDVVQKFEVMQSMFAPKPTTTQPTKDLVKLPIVEKQSKSTDYIYDPALDYLDQFLKLVGKLLTSKKVCIDGLNGTRKSSNVVGVKREGYIILFYDLLLPVIDQYQADNGVEISYDVPSLRRSLSADGDFVMKTPSGQSSIQTLYYNNKFRSWRFNDKKFIKKLHLKL